MAAAGMRTLLSRGKDRVQEFSPQEQTKRYNLVPGMELKNSLPAVTLSPEAIIY